VNVSMELVEAAQASAATARKRVEAGAAPVQEQLRAEVQLEQSGTELAGFRRDLAMARHSLATLLGEPERAEARLQGTLAESPDAGLMKIVVGEDSLGKHPSAVAAQANLDAAQLAQRRAMLEPYPDMKLGVSGGRIGETDQNIIQLGFSFPVPILDRGKGKQQEAQANVSVAEAELRSVQQRLQRELANARRRYTTAVEQVQSYRQRILPKAAEALRLVQTGFEEGKFDFIDLVDTQRTTAEVRLGYQHKLLEMNVAHAELEAIMKRQAGEQKPTPNPEF